MGWVDRHNRFRQDILGLHRVWKTKRWQTRIQLEMIGMALVDTFLLCRKFQPQWRPNDCNTESAFWQFTRHLLPQISPAHAQPLASLDHSGGSSCCQVSIGKRTTKSSEKGNVGKKYTSQARCHYCKLILPSARNASVMVPTVPSPLVARTRAFGAMSKCAVKVKAPVGLSTSPTP